MSYQLAWKKAGLPLIRSFLHSSEGIQTAIPALAQRRNKIEYKIKSFKDGKVADIQQVSTYEDAFPAKGDKK